MDGLVAASSPLQISPCALEGKKTTFATGDCCQILADGFTDVVLMSQYKPKGPTKKTAELLIINQRLHRTLLVLLKKKSPSRVPSSGTFICPRYRWASKPWFDSFQSHFCSIDDFIVVESKQKELRFYFRHLHNTNK